MGHIFISYSHKDTDYAHRLASTLQADGFDVWIDARIDYGSQWPYEIQKQLDSCDAFILIMSPRSFISEWVQSELQRAKRKLKPTFPLLLEGDEPWLSVESTQYYDVRGETLPDEKFYSTLRRVASRSEGQAVQLPAKDIKNTLKPNSSIGSPKLRIGIVLAVIGGIAALLAVFIPLIWANLSQRPTSVAENTATSAPAEVSLGGTQGSESTSTDTSAIPVTAPDSSDFMDSNGVSMRLVPAGEFTMGTHNLNDALAECQKYNSDCDRSWFEDEEPPHTVSLDAFYIDTFEVTNRLYAVCVNAGACQLPTYTGSETRSSYYGNSEFDNFPVIFVDWNMAKTYCEWRGARLPTEAEWEKAARGNDEHMYPWGEEADASYANYNNDIADTTAVGSYESGKSPYGLYDMAGNVLEWVADRYSDTYYQNSPLSNPLGPDSGSEYVIRGGSWYDAAYLIRTTVRNSFVSTEVENNFGIRCARDVTP